MEHWKTTLTCPKRARSGHAFIQQDFAPCQSSDGATSNLTRLEPSFSILPRPTIPAQCLILGDFSDALRLLVAHLNRRDPIAIGDAARDFMTSGLDFL